MKKRLSHIHLPIIGRFICIAVFLVFLIIDCLFALPTNENRKSYVRFIAVGDIMLGRGIDNRISKNGPEWAFKNLSNCLQTADVLFGNAEFSSITASSPTTRGYVLGASTTTIKSLQCAGFDIVSLANNHTLDYGRKGLVSLIDELDKLKIMYVGGGKNYFDAQSPKVIEKNSIKICFLAYSLFFEDNKDIDKTLPTLAMFSEEKMEKDIEIAKSSASIVVVSFHWGVEYSSSPTSYQRKVAHLAVDCGANLIIGHHSHVIQGIEIYKDTMILYSLGNFIFDSKNEKTKEGLVFQCSISSSNISGVSLLPIYISKFRPTRLDLDYCFRIAKQVQELSKKFSVPIMYRRGKIYIKGK